ncbi:MAG: site-2 protease family protein, partial [Candidatus Nealsonbacteria bacterium]|nr:site-2 protease family protein [Candidatus Nealsonbacteria bacterium]
MLLIIIAFISLIGLMALHEFGHFILAKKFGVKVEEFGIGYPPRLFGKKIGETIYSLNLLPFGAFVKIPGEIKKTAEANSFSNQPIVKRMLIVAGGVISFWIVAAVLFSIVFMMGARISVDDKAENLIDPKIQVAMLTPGSPAKIAGVQLGDTIQKLSVNGQTINIENISQVQNFSNDYRGKQILLIVERGEEILNINLIPRVSPPSGEGPLGVALVRTALKSYPVHEAIFQGVKTTGETTIAVIQGWYFAIQKAIAKQPTGAELVGPVGIFQMMTQFGKLGTSYFLQFIAMLAVYLALFNILPIPATDGGKLIFLSIEAIRKKPL